MSAQTLLMAAANAVVGTTWDPANKAASVTLSNGNLTAAMTAVGSAMVRSTTSRTSLTGRFFLEFTLPTISADIAVGLVNAAEGFSPSGGLGADANSMGFYPSSPAQATYVNGVQLNGGSTGSSAGAIVSMAVNLFVGPPTVWISTAVMRAAGTPWNNSATANPNTLTGGQSLTGLNVGPYFAAFNDDINGVSCVINCGSSPFNQPIPTGFTAWN